MIDVRLALRSVIVSGDWSPLLSQLPGWTRASDGTWTDGDGFLRCVTHPAMARMPTVAFRYLAPPARSGQRAHGASEELMSPSGLIIGIDVSGRQACAPSTYTLNHAAFRVPEVAAERKWFETVLGSCTVLERDSTWDPVAQTYWPDAHLFRPPDFYVTLRGGFESAAIDHVGWMTDTAAAVDAVARTLRRIGWPILFGPASIDESYLVHFCGPDGAVHDFFYPQPSIVSRAEAVRLQ